MKPAHPLAWWRASVTAALLFIQSARYLPWAASTYTVALTPESVNLQQGRTLFPPEACQDFYQQEALFAGHIGERRNDTSTAMALVMPPATPFWQASDCTDVWTSWTQSLPSSLRPSYSNRRRLRDLAADMRQRGTKYRWKGYRVTQQALRSVDGVGQAGPVFCSFFLESEESSIFLFAKCRVHPKRLARILRGKNKSTRVYAQRGRHQTSRG